MKQYHDLLRRILAEGTKKEASRAGLPDSLSLFGHQMKFDLSSGFPLLTTKKIHTKSVIAELLWFLRGSSNIKWLNKHNCTIWNQDAYRHYKNICNDQNYEFIASFDEFMDMVKNNEYADELHKLYTRPYNYDYGDLGNVYGYQWRRWNGEHDQLKTLIEGIRTNPEGRRHIISAWNVDDIDSMALPPCHVLMQFNCRKIANHVRWIMLSDYINKHNLLENQEFRSLNVEERLEHCNIPQYYLDCQLYQRSADVFLGVPFNIASYALLTHLIGLFVGMVPGNFIHTFGDVHIYDNHMNQVKEQLRRDVDKYQLPELDLSEVTNLFKQEYPNELIEKISFLGVECFIDMIQPEMIKIVDYESYPTIKGDLSVGN